MRVTQDYSNFINPKGKSLCLVKVERGAPCVAGFSILIKNVINNKTLYDSERKRIVTEEDEALEEEKKKNLEILQSILGSGQQTCSKTASKAKTFR